MSCSITVEPLDPTVFAAIGDVIDSSGNPGRIINQRLCSCYHNRARPEITSGTAGLSLFQAKPSSLPLAVEMMERQPAGSQAFIAMSMDCFPVTVAKGENEKPAFPHASQTSSGQAVNFYRDTRHGTLTPLAAPGFFAVVDRVWEGPVLEEHCFDTQFLVELCVEPASDGAG